MIKKLLLVSLLTISAFSHAMKIGFNQAWFHNNYASQYLDGSFDESEVDRIFRLTSEAGSKTLRLWFFEGSDFPMVEWKNGEMVGPRADFIKNVLKTLQIAKSYDVKVYMTLLDAHTYRPDKLNRESLRKLRAIFNQKGGALFLTKVIGPLLKAIEESGLSSAIGKIDLCNEMDTVVNRFGFDHGWQGAGKMLCQWRSFIQGYDSFKNIPVTFSIRLHPLLFQPLNLLSDNGPLACADVLDFHSYSDAGTIHKCSQLKRYALKNKKKLILGEFGQSYFTNRYDDNLQYHNTSNYLKSAMECGFSEALSWRLSDIRPGVNKEARYSFEAYGKMRPAYWLIQKHNLNRQ
jgi:hypothetical protein